MRQLSWLLFCVQAFFVKADFLKKTQEVNLL